MLTKIINFIKYHNAFSIGFAIVFLSFSVTMAASDTARGAVLGEKISKIQGIDNSMLLSTNFDDFNWQMTILGIEEDDDNYYVGYSFTTLDIKDHIWQIQTKGGQLKVSKKQLRNRDLGLYVQEELGEIIDAQLSYLNKVKKKEQSKGQTLLVKTTEYTKLLGLVLDSKTRELPGYEPVKKKEIAVSSITPESVLEPESTPISEPASEPTPEPETIATTSAEPTPEPATVSELAPSATSTPVLEPETIATSTSSTSEEVVDLTPPIITLIGSSTVQVLFGDTYVDLGATALDDIDGDITANIIVTNPVDTSATTTYSVLYNVSDAAGNTALEVARTVEVVDEIQP